MSSEINLIGVSYTIDSSLRFLTRVSINDKIENVNKRDLRNGWRAVNFADIMFAFQIPLSDFSSKREHCQGQDVW